MIGFRTRQVILLLCFALIPSCLEYVSFWVPHLERTFINWSIFRGGPSGRWRAWTSCSKRIGWKKQGWEDPLRIWQLASNIQSVLWLKRWDSTYSTCPQRAELGTKGRRCKEADLGLMSGKTWGELELSLEVTPLNPQTWKSLSKSGWPLTG